MKVGKEMAASRPILSLVIFQPNVVRVSTSFFSTSASSPSETESCAMAAIGRIKRFGKKFFGGGGGVRACNRRDWSQCLVNTNRNASELYSGRTNVSSPGPYKFAGHEIVTFAHRLYISVSLGGWGAGAGDPRISAPNPCWMFLDML